MSEVKILKQDIMPVDALPLYKEETDFVLTKDELDVVLNEKCEQGDGGTDVKISTTDNLLKNEKLQRVKTFILSRFNHYVENVLMIENCFYLTQSWSAINEKGSNHHLHVHPNTVLTCVYYAAANPDSGNELHLKWTKSRLQEAFFFSYKRKNFNIFNSPSTVLKVKTGDIVMFPGWINHKSLENKSYEKRIIIGTNYFVMGKLGTFEHKDYIEVG